MFLFCFSFFPSIYFASEGGYYTHSYKTKCCKKKTLTYMPPTTLLLTKPAGSLFSPHLHCSSLFFFLEGTPTGSASFKKLHYIAYCAIILQKLRISSKKEQQNDKIEEMEEFKHML